MKKCFLLAGTAFVALSAQAQCFKDGYVEQGFGSPEFAHAVDKWAANQQVTADDNFFISRVKPKKRFRNTATQVREDLTEANDKRLLAWIPINNPLNNALPDGKFDSEVFNMWSYVTHFGDWTATLGRVPAALADVAHKNGVGVSGVASIPNNSLTVLPDWSKALDEYAALNHETAYQFLKFYGNDGLGYNSEFTGGNMMLPKLRQLHIALNKAAAQDGNSAFENFWYDGTNDRGGLYFDRGLGGHNKQNFGEKGKEAASLFFNYNWNKDNLLPKSVEFAQKIGRDPLYLYAGVNMQGGEPHGESWPLLNEHPISIGLWGAHTYNMFWESRNEKGSTDEAKMNTYMLRTERYFTGGTRNPANCPEIKSIMAYHADNTDFHGMASMMSARSSLSWDLATEPFITYFNLGNGKFFNWMGKRQNDNEWYNIGVQDYLPTWRYWFSSKLLGKSAADVLDNGLNAQFTWNDAYVGGSSLHITGSSNNEYLHLFKTEYKLQTGDIITVRYKLNAGSAQMNLVLTAKGAEGQAINEGAFKLLGASDLSDHATWVEKKFTVDEHLTGKDLALVALHFEGAKQLDLNLGEFSIVRGSFATPAQPEIVSSEVLAYNKSGVDGKLIFNMANDKAKNEPCYNIDVNTSLFKLYAQQEGGEKRCMGITSSWAALYYSVPMDHKLGKKVRFGVSAVSLDMKHESEIAWGEYNAPTAYEFDDNIVANQTTIKPGETFELSYVDANHEEGTWELVNHNGESVFTGKGVSVTIEGLAQVGSYTLKLTGMEYDNDRKARVETVRTFPAFVQITPESTGALPAIYTLTANGKEADIHVNAHEAVTFAYTGRDADGSLSRGLNLSEKGFGFKAMDAGYVNGMNAFSYSFWVKFNSLEGGSIQFFDLRDQGAGWPTDNWGLVWSTYEPASNDLQFTIRGKQGAEHTNHWNVHFVPGVWTHVSIVMEANGGKGVREHVYIDGVKANVTHYSDGDKSGEGENPYYAQPTNWWDNIVFIIGQGRHQCAAMDAVIDDVKFYNVALTDAEVKAGMNTTNGKEAVLYTFEKEVDAQFAFANETGKQAVIAGSLDMSQGEGAKVGAFNLIAPVYQAGCPFVEGSQYAVTTEASWNTRLAEVSATEGNATAGSAQIKFLRDGVYNVTLTLSNSYGADSKTLSAITVGAGETGIDNAEVLETEVGVENGMALVNFASEGNYVVNVYNAAGQLVATQAQYMAAGEQAQLALGQAGVYVLSVLKDGKAVANVKLLNK